MTKLTEQQKHSIDAKRLECHDMLSGLSRYFARKNPNHIVDIEDYYQESIIALINSYLAYDPHKGAWMPYLKQSLINELARVASLGNSPVSINSRIFRISHRIHTLEEKGMIKEEIINALGITERDYLQSKNVLTRGDISTEPPEPNQEAKEIVNDIKEMLSDEEKKLIDLSLAQCEIKEIATEMGWTYEWTRIKLKRLFKKIKVEYGPI